MDHNTLGSVFCAIVALLGLVMLNAAIKGMRRGEYQFRGSWFHKGEDGLGFWLLTGTTALASLAVIIISIWFFITRILR